MLREKLENQTFKEFLKDSIYNSQPRHKAFWTIIFANFAILLKVYYDTIHPQLLPERARVLEAGKTPFYKTHALSASLGLLDNAIEKYDKRFWDMIQKAKEGTL